MFDPDQDAGTLWHHFNLVMSWQAALICCPASPAPHREAILASDKGSVGAFKHVAKDLGDEAMYALADQVGRLMDRVDWDERDGDGYAALGAEMAALSGPLATAARKYSEPSDSSRRAPCGLGLPDCTRG